MTRPLYPQRKRPWKTYLVSHILDCTSGLGETRHNSISHNKHTVSPQWRGVMVCAEPRIYIRHIPGSVS